MPTLNIPRATQVLAIITQHPDLHDQGDYVFSDGGFNYAVPTPVALPDGNLCNTAHCIAGWTEELAGRRLRRVTEEREDNYFGAVSHLETLRGDEWVHISPNTIWLNAQAELGLTDMQATKLFSASTTNAEAALLLAKYIKKALKKEVANQSDDYYQRPVDEDVSVDVHVAPGDAAALQKLILAGSNA